MTKFCPFCGEELVDDAKFCKNCGKKLDNVQVSLDEDRTHTPVTDNDHTAAYILGIIAALLFPLIGIIIGAYIYTRKDSSKASRRGITVIGLSVLVWIASVILLRY